MNCPDCGSKLVELLISYACEKCTFKMSRTGRRLEEPKLQPALPPVLQASEWAGTPTFKTIDLPRKPTLNRYVVLVRRAAEIDPTATFAWLHDSLDITCAEEHCDEIAKLLHAFFEEEARIFIKEHRHMFGPCPLLASAPPLRIRRPIDG